MAQMIDAADQHINARLFSDHELASLQQQASLVAPLTKEVKQLKEKLARAQKRVEFMTAAMRSANPLTPFDLPMNPSSTLSSPATYSESVEATEAAAVQSIPAAHLPHFQNVELVISRGALGGWVEQASPACGAAAVAGAWNAIKPADAARASKEDVLLLYANKWRQHIRQSCVSLAQLLQVPDAAPLHAAIHAAWPFTDQTWVEGEPVKGKSAKPAKPSKSAALQLLQQLTSQHCPGTCTTEDGADAVMSSNAAAALVGQGIGPTVSPQSVSSQPEMGTADDSQLLQPQPQSAFDLPLNRSKIDSEAEVINGIESDSEAEISLRGRVASDEEDDRQGPGPVTSAADAQGSQALSVDALHTAGSEADEAKEAEPVPDCTLANMLKGTADKPRMSRAMQQQQRRLLRSHCKASSQPEVVLALTEAQQQQWQQEEDTPLCGTGMAASTAASHDCSSMSIPTTHTAVSDAKSISGQGRLNAQLDEQSTSQAVSEEGEQGGAGPSGRAQGPNEHQLWHNLAEALQEKQKCQKLAQLTVTLLGRMRAVWNLTKGRPSTAPVGNDALMAALRQLSAQHGQEAAVWRFMSAGKRRAQYTIQRQDSNETVQEQWQALVKVLQEPNSALLYHLENHYCLVFAARSWHLNAGYSGCKQVWQVLVARPGQKPCAWVSFDSLRQNLLSWQGYALMAACWRQDTLVLHNSETQEQMHEAT